MQVDGQKFSPIFFGTVHWLKVKFVVSVAMKKESLVSKTARAMSLINIGRDTNQNKSVHFLGML